MELMSVKVLAIVLALATTAFCVSTIVLAVQKADLEDDLQDALNKLDQLSTTTTNPPSSISTPTPTVPTDPSPTAPTNPTEATPPTESTPSVPTPPTESTPSVPTPPTESTPSVPTPPTESTPSMPTPSTPSPTLTTPSEKPVTPTLPPGLTDPEDILYRLPNDIRPIKYQIYYQPHMTEGTFDADISIQIEIDKSTNLIAMHAKHLEISGISILNMMGRMRIRVKRSYTDDIRELLIIELEELLYTATPYVVSMSYKGRLDGLTGMYASTYLNPEGKERWIATSKFEPTYARQAFPCFDEPAMKATFKVTIVYPTGDGYHALSNMDIEDQVTNGMNTEVHFRESVPMSTYLACFIVSDFDFKKATIRGTLENAEDIELRVYSTPAQIDKVDFALNMGVGVTEYYIGYFNITYPLPKLDMAAIPDFVSGATEHWGLVTFRETALLYDEKISSSENKKRVATVVAHEIAHMWFGNLVTMKWWNDLWLNEGFASYIEYKGMNAVHPEWMILHHFICDDLQPVMDLDATRASHPIVQTVESPDEITELFDSITYNKGASIVRMLEDLVGEEHFRTAVSSYLDNHMYSSAETDDFLAEFEPLELSFNVKLILQTWTEQMGLPVVEVTKNGNNYKLTQKRFFSNPDDYNEVFDDSQFNYHWSIPITYFTSANSEVQSTLFNYNDNELSITLPSAVDWIKFNKNQIGYYRVNYPVEMWRELITALNERRGDFSISDRGHLINDVFSLADAQQLDYDIALDLTTYLEKELDYVPWNVALSHLGGVRSLLYYTDIYRDFVVYARKLMLNVYVSVGWEVVGTDISQNLLRSTLLNAACSYGHKDALSEATKRFTTWLEKPEERPHPDLRSTIYYFGMQQVGNEQTWEKVWELYVSEQDAQEKLKLMRSLAAIKEPWILQRFINLAWNESNVRSQDYFSCLQMISANRVGQSLVWDYVRENWPRLVERFGINERTLGRLIPSITKSFGTQTKLAEMESFFAKYPEAGAGTAARKQALEYVKNNIKWLEHNKQKVSNWLANQTPGERNRLQ